MIYAKQVNPEWFDYRDYEYDFYDNHILVDGGRDFCDIDPDKHLKQIKTLINDYQCYDYEYYYGNSIKAYLTDMLPKKVNGKRLSPKEIKRIKNALDADYRYYSDYEQSVIVKCLSIIYGHPYKCVTIKGCMQCEWAILYAPYQTNTDYYEAIYFGTGTEIEINTETPENEIKEPSDINGYRILTTDYDLKQAVAKECCVDESEIVLWEWDGYTRIEKYRRV